MRKDRQEAKNFSNRLDGEAAAAGFSDEIDEKGDSGVSQTVPTKASSLRKGGHVLLRGNPCKIVEVMTSKPGKHGHAKVHVVGLDVFTGKKYEDISPSHHVMQVPELKKLEFQVVDMGDDGFLCLMDDAGNTRRDLRAPDGDVRKKIRDMLDTNEDPTKDPFDSIMVCVQEMLGREEIVSVKAGFK